MQKNGSSDKCIVSLQKSDNVKNMVKCFGVKINSVSLRTDRWQSGLMRPTENWVVALSARGFESHPLTFTAIIYIKRVLIYLVTRFFVRMYCRHTAMTRKPTEFLLYTR